MPTYVYECSSCSKVFEAEQRITADPLDVCVECGSQGAVKRVIQPIAVMFKGSGFHINDYAGAGSAPSTSTSAAPAVETAPAETAAPAPAPETAASTGDATPKTSD